MARTKKVDLDLAGYEGMTALELKNTVCRLLVDKFSLKDQKKEYSSSINEALKEIDARLEHIVVVLKTKEQQELADEAQKLISAGRPKPPAKPKV